MQSNLPPEILATIIGISCAIIGYGFREYRNRTKPFFHIIRIDGSATQASDPVDIDRDLTRLINESVFIKALDDNASLGDVSERRESAIRVKHQWPAIASKIKKLIHLTDENEMLAVLYELFQSSFFEQMMLTLLVFEKIKFTNSSSVFEEKIAIFDDKDNNGSVWICFPGHAKNFGSSFKSPAIKTKCNPFLDSIRYLDRPTILSCFNQVLNIMQSEFNRSLLIEPKLNDMINMNSRWIFYCYCANLSGSPMVINPDAIIAIRDKKNNKFNEKCHLAVIKNESVQETEVPIVIKQGEDVSCCFISDKIQKDMDYGAAIRESFESGQSSCKISVTLSKIGLIAKQSAWSSPFSFSG